MALRKTITKLPVVLQTDTQKEFFSATFDQLFSPANVEQAQGFIGRKSGSAYTIPDDNYISEPNKSRAAYQLEPIAYAINSSTLEQTNEVFYEDIVNYIRFRGGNVDNHDRLFAGDFYSFAPPIDIDKFINFQNYVWLEENIPIIYIQSSNPSGDFFDDIIETKILGQEQFNTGQDVTLTPANLQLSSGMRVRFEGSSSYDRAYYVEGVGRNIKLVPELPIVLPGGATTFIPWDIDAGEAWDMQQWDATTEADLSQKDYITIERGSAAGDPWTRTNRWFHTDVISRTQEVGQLLEATVEFGGLGYTVGDRLEVTGDGSGGEITVSSVDLFGTILAVRISRRGQDYSLASIDETGSVILSGGIKWDQSPVGSGTVWESFSWDQVEVPATGTGAIISFTLASQVSRTNRASRPILEYKSNIQLYNFGKRYLGTVDVVSKNDTVSDIQGQASYIVDGISLTDGMKIIFLDPAAIPSFLFWDDPSLYVGGPYAGFPRYGWDDSDGAGPLSGGQWDVSGVAGAVTRFIWNVNLSGGTIVLEKYDPYTGVVSGSAQPLAVGDVVLVEQGTEFSGASFYQEEFIEGDDVIYRWVEGQEKVDQNQAPLFELYDINGIHLDDTLAYENSTFVGNEIFSYRIRNQDDVDATGESLVADGVLGFPLTFSGLKQITDIVFENDLETNRVFYGPTGLDPTEIPGYYFFKTYTTATNDIFTIEGETFETNWKASTEPEKQRVIDRFLSDGTASAFQLSVVPYNEDVYVEVSGRRLNDDEFIYLARTNTVEIYGKASEYDTQLGDGFRQAFSFPNIGTLDVGEVANIYVGGVYQEEGVDFEFIAFDPSYTINFNVAPPAGSLVIAYKQAAGVLEENTLVEIFSYTHSMVTDAVDGFFEIPNELENNPNNEEITENSWNELSSHFVSIIENQAPYYGQAFGAGNNYRDSARDGSLGTYVLQNQSPLLKAMLFSSTAELDIVNAIRFSAQEYTRFKNKFIKIGAQLINEGFTPFNAGDAIPVNQWVDEIIRRITLSREYSDAFKDTYMIAWSNIYDEEEFAGNGTQTEFTITNFVDLDDKRNVMYVYVNGVLTLADVAYTVTNKNPIQITFTTAPVPGAEIIVRLYENAAPAHIPATPSKLGIYPVSKPRIITDSTYVTPVDMIVGHDGSKTPVFGDYRDDMLLELETRIYNGIIETFRVGYTPPLEIVDLKPGKFRDTRWSREEWKDIVDGSFFKWASTNKVDYRVNDVYDQNDEWTWNYSTTEDADGEMLPGYWRGIFEYYYDTQTPDTTPWEMLGFAEMPDWWITAPNSEGFSGYGNGPWQTTTPKGSQMWADIEAGRIRRGPRAGIDSRYARPELAAKYLPVDSNGILKPLPTLCIDTTSSIGVATDGTVSDRWMFGDAAPAEYAWMTSESYPFAIAEAMFLTRPAEFAEKFWDPEHTYAVPASPAQIVTNAEGLYKRTGNTALDVHGETRGGNPVINTGYQVWITAQLRTLGKDIATEFGDKIRSLNVKLGHKMASFTDRDTMRLFVEGISVSSSAANQLVPAENIQVELHTGAPVREYVYSGVLIKTTEAGTFEVYGYDLLANKFRVIPRVQSARDQNINVGGQPAAFTNFETGRTYEVGSIVRLNTIFYRCTKAHVATKFITENWNKLSSLPILGGINVTYHPQGANGYTEVPYGTQFKTVQEVFDFLVSYGAWLELEGFVFENTDPETSSVQNWLNTAKEYLFWVGSKWEANSVIALSPAALGVELTVQEGYPASVERIVNGVYSILDKNGVAIDPVNTTVKRDGRNIKVLPFNDQQGIFCIRLNTTETENIVTIDNVTEFNDVIYDPKLGTRQERLFFNGRRTLDWTGKLEAAGYIITEDGLLPNFENLTNSIRLYHDTESTLDNPQMENTAKHLIGFDERPYFEDLQILEDAQFLFYQGMIRQKGTEQAIRKLERNSLVTDTDQALEVYGEWALRLDEYGPVCNNITTEFLLRANEIKVDPQLVNLSYPPTSGSGTVTAITVISATNVWSTPPTIYIVNHPEDLTGEGALATAILGSDGRLARIDILAQGSGYTKAPYVYVGSPTLTSTSDRAQATVTVNTVGALSAAVASGGLGYTVGNQLTVQGGTPATSPLILTVTTVAGPGVITAVVLGTGKDYYVLPDNPVTVTGGSGSGATFTISWQSTNTIGTINSIVEDDTTDDVIYIDIDDNTRWISKPSNTACTVPDELWPSMDYDEAEFKIPNAGYVHPDDVQWSTFSYTQIKDLFAAEDKPENGDMIWVANGDNEGFAVYHMTGAQTVLVEQYNEDSTTLDPIWNVVYEPGLCSFSTPLEDEVVADSPNHLQNTIAIDGNLYTFEARPATSYLYFYVLTDLETGLPVEDAVFNESDVNASLPVSYFFNLRFSNRIHRDQNVYIMRELQPQPTKVWLDNDTYLPSSEDLGWSVKPVVPTGVGNGIRFDIALRQEEPLVDTSKFRNAYVYEYESKDTVLQLDVYDPFKGILPGIADLNIHYKTRKDPTRYTNSADPRLIGDATFDKDNVGEVWWDLSTCAYIYYEQDNNTFRRDKWGTLINGSSVDIYEWTRSSVPPELYTGDGIPKNMTDYVLKNEWDPLLEEVRTFYYFWVSEKTLLPGRQDRTIPTFEIARTLTNPKGQGYQWFSPVSQTGFVFAGLASVFTDSDNVLQINYTKNKYGDEKKHVEWELGREGDVSYRVNTIHWDKMVDSLVGYTNPVPIGSSTADESLPPLDNFNNAVPTATDPTMGYLIVPDPSLSIHNRYGMKKRPLQSMFKSILGARRIFVDKVNDLVAPILLRDINPTWNSSMSTNTLWEWVDWYEDGWTQDRVVPTRQVQNVAELNDIDNAFQNEVVKVTTSRTSYYAYDVASDQWTLVAKKDSRLQLKSAIYENKHNLPESLELRELINALVNEVFVSDQFININLVFFAMLNYVFQEQEDIDWAFKTTYIYLKQTGQALTQNRVFQADPFDSAVDYINEAKPYHSKLRDYRITRSAETENALGDAEEVVRDTKVKMLIDRFRCDLSVAEMRIAKQAGRDVHYNGYTTLRTIGDRKQFLYNDPLADVDITQVVYNDANIAYGNKSTIEILGGNWSLNIGTGDIVIISNSRFNNGTYTVVQKESNSVISVAERLNDETDTVPTSVIEVYEATGTQEARLGAAGRFVLQQKDLLGQIADINSIILEEYIPVYSYDFGAFDAAPYDRYFLPNAHATGTEELEAVAEINRRMAIEFECDLQANQLINTTFSGRPTLISASVATAGTGYGLYMPASNVAYTDFTGSGGLGYTMGDTLTVVGGTPSNGYSATTLTVDSVDGFGKILTLSFLNNAPYDVLPPYPATVTGGTGTGASFALNYQPQVLQLDAGGGTPVAAAQLRITGVSGGGITSLQVVNGGSYYVTPTTTPVNLLGGTGAGGQAAGLLFVAGNTQPWDTVAWDVIGWDSDGETDTTITTLDGLGDYADNLHNFAAIDPEETFTGNGATKEFTLTTLVPTYFMFVVVDGLEKRRNIDYFFIGNRLVFIQAPSNNATISLYTYIEAGDLINPQVTAGIADEMVPLDPRENLVLVADHQIVQITNPGTGYTEGDLLTVVGGTGTPTTLRVLPDGAPGGTITRVAIETEGSYTVEPTYPAAVTGGTGANAQFGILPSYSFRYHYDTAQGTTYLRNADSKSTRLAVAIGMYDTIIPVVNAAVLEEQPTTINEPNVAWIGNERIEYYGIDTTNNLLTAVKRGTKGTPLAAHPAGTKVFDGGPDQEMPTPEIYWVNSTTTWYSGSQGQWRDNGDGFAYFSDLTNNAFSTGTNARLKDTLKITGTNADGKYFIYGRIAVGELSIVDITAAGTGYSVGDPILVTGDGSLGTAEVALVGPLGEVLQIRITNRGSGYTSATLDLTGFGDGNATATVVTNRQALILSSPSPRYTPSGKLVGVDGITWQTDNRNNGGLYNSTTAPALFLLEEPGSALPKV